MPRSSKKRVAPPSLKSCLSHTVVAGLAFHSGVLTGGQALCATGANANKNGLERVAIGSASTATAAPDVSTSTNTTSNEKQAAATDTPNKPTPPAAPIPPTANCTNNGGRNIRFGWPNSMRSLFVGAARIQRDDFMYTFDIGVPLETATPTNSEMLLLYGPGSVPNTDEVEADPSDGSSRAIPFIPSVRDATEKCDIVKQILVQPDPSPVARSCVALVGQWESYHVHKWLRTDSSGALDREADFQNVARSHTGTGRGTQQNFPRHGQTVLMAGKYGEYMKTGGILDEVYVELKPLAAKVAQRGVHNNTVVVMVVNKGQSVLLANFVCGAKYRGIDTSKILLFASDLHTKRLAESLGLTAYYNERLFGEFPENAAKHYGDAQFKTMMMAKAYVVHIINLFGHNVLFQDADIVWFKDPLPYFETEASPNFDIYFQDDGQHSVRYAPYSPNTGFYYVRHNMRTQFLLSQLVRMGDVVMNTGSHQETMTSLMAEHSSRTGLKVKTISRDEPYFPTGFHYHHRQAFMNDMFSGKANPYIFHMCWTEGKDDKIKYFQQMGEWYWSEESGCDNPESAGNCCLSEPLFRCHDRRKPSKESC